MGLDEAVSDYERMRLVNIQRNQRVLDELGLNGNVKTFSKPENSTSSRQKKRSITTDRNSRRSKRLRNTRTKSKLNIDENSVNSEQEKLVKEIAKPVKEELVKEVSEEENEVISVGAATSARSTCRGCKEKLEKGEIRVGMKAWIMGRNSVTWQHPKCFLGNVRVQVANKRSSKSKLSGIGFAPGDLKFGLCSHTATSWVKPEEAKVLLDNLVFLHLDDQSKGYSKDWIKTINGYADLSEEEKLQLNNIFSSPKNRKKIKAENKPGQKGKNQPACGKTTKSGGKVGWRFGGHICYGTLLPSRETKTHCYARTHKGNVKTLAKGKDYWWRMV